MVLIVKMGTKTITILVISVVVTCSVSSPVDKITVPEAYIPVHIQADDSYPNNSVPSQSQQNSTTVPIPTTTISQLEDDAAVTETIAADAAQQSVEITDAPDTASSSPKTPKDANEFPTPLPFLDEPETKSGDDDQDDESAPSSVPARGTLIPPNFDLKKIPGIGVKPREGNEVTSVYVGRSACKCGVAGERRFQFNDTKIVGGEPAPIEEYPWTAALLRRNWLGLVSDRPYCGGTLINNLYILTASHCVDSMSPRGIVVALHEEDIASNSETPSGTTRYEVEKIIMHQNYNRRSIDNDIALIKLAKPVPLNNVLIPACLPANNDVDFVNFTATAAGWGATKESGSTSNILRKVDVPVMSNEVCNTKTKYKGKITDNMLCAGYEEGGKDSCQGDSGGPLTIENGDRLTLIGVVSWGYGCARPNSPGVYTRVARYPEWIVANSKDAEWCLE